MGLDVWFSDDLARALRAIRVAGREAQAEERNVMGADPVMDAYWRGYRAALASVGEAFGVRSAVEIEELLPPPTVMTLPHARVVIAVPPRGGDEEEAYGN